MSEPRKVPIRLILSCIWLTVASIGVLGLVYRWRSLIFHIVVAVFIALVLNPAVVRLQQAGMKRGPAILAVVAFAVLVVVGLGALVAAPLTTQGVAFAKHAPQYLRLAQHGKGPFADFARKFHLETQLKKIAPAVSRAVYRVPSQILGVLRSAASTAFSVGIVLILAIFMLIEGPTLISAFVSGLPEANRQSIRGVGQMTSKVVSGYTLGVTGLAVLNGLVTAAVLFVTGVPFVASLAVWAGIADVLPVVGGLIAIVPAGLFAFAHSLTAGIVVVAVMLGYQQIKNHILYPLAVGRAVELNALLVLVAVLAGQEIMGIPGALLAIPVAGVLHAIILEYAPDPAKAFLRHSEPPQPQGSSIEVTVTVPTSLGATPQVSVSTTQSGAPPDQEPQEPALEATPEPAPGTSGLPAAHTAPDPAQQERTRVGFKLADLIRRWRQP